MTQRAPRVAIVTLAGDLHAYVLRRELQEAHGVDVAIIASDTLSAAGGLNWTNTTFDSDAPEMALPTEDGGSVAIRDLDLVWWRRCHGKPTVPESVTDPQLRKLVIKDNRAALRGALLAGFRGTWISDPYATERAQNKLLQLTIAREVGITVPRTLVSTDPTAVRDFTRAHGGTVIAKTLTGLLGTSLEAGRVTLESLADDDEITVSATVYQEEVPGTDHLRVMVFGDAVLTARIRSRELDWRLANDMEVEPVTMDERLAEALREVVRRLGLRMGVFDLKVRPDGHPVFLEINPQGQFLFVEGMSDMPLGEAFAQFIVDELAEAPLRLPS
jgi:glutathione synthase/RimK-type ligase-like ATP-grasp enzyme